MHSFCQIHAQLLHMQGGHFPGHVLYLRQLENFMALVCVMREETFKKKVNGHVL